MSPRLTNCTPSSMSIQQMAATCSSLGSRRRRLRGGCPATSAGPLVASSRLRSHSVSTASWLWSSVTSSPARASSLNRAGSVVPHWRVPAVNDRSFDAVISACAAGVLPEINGSTVVPRAVQPVQDPPHSGRADCDSDLLGLDADKLQGEWTGPRRRPLRHLSQRLGHASIRTTYNIYGHLFEGRYRHAARARTLAGSPRTLGRSEGPSLEL